MTTNKRRVTTRKTRKTTKTKRISKKAEAKAKKQIYLKIAVVLIVVISVLVWFVNSSYWPWPSNAEIGRRLNELIDVCMYNENSRGCDSLKNRYNMSFEYCHSLAEIPEIGKTPTIYGVAKVKNFTTQSLSYEGMKSERLIGIPASNDPLKNTTTLVNEREQEWDKEHGKGDTVFPYYGCVSYIDEVGTSNSDDLIINPESLALFELSQIPQRNASGDNISGCRTYWGPGFNDLWNEIPNIETIKNEYDIAFNTYNSCKFVSELQTEQVKINAKMYDYAHNKAVQLFYKAYDEWNTREHKSCTWKSSDGQSEKSFPQTCGEGRKMSDFIRDMQQYTTTDYFTSKIVIQ